MINFSSLLMMQCLLFLYMLLGYVVTKKHILSVEGRKCLTDLLIDVILPCNIISSFYVKMDKGVLVGAIEILLLAFAIQLLQLGLSRILYRHISGKRRKVLEYGTITSNAGYLGNPVAEGIYGSDGLLYTSVYLIPARLFLWSAGLMCFTKVSKGEVIKKLLKHPCIISVEIGLAVMLLQIPIPEILLRFLKGVGGCTTVCSMLIIGAVIAEADLRTIISRDNLYYCFVRLILVPGLVMVFGMYMHLHSMALGVAVILAGMPAGATTTILAAKYDGDADFASKCTVLSTLLSMVTIPLLCSVLMYLHLG